MVRLADTWLSNGDPHSGVVTLSGRYRLASDVLSELTDHLARSEARIVVCDLGGMSVSHRDMSQVFASVTPYLAAWPGTVVALGVPDPIQYSRTLPVAIADRLLVHRSIESALREARALVSPMVQTRTSLAPMPTAAAGARDFVNRSLRDWQMTDLAWPASLVTSELVTNSLKHAATTVLTLTLACVHNRLRIAVHDHGGGDPAIPRRSEAEAAAEPHGRGLQLIDAESLSWGVFTTRGSGKTVWVLLDPPRSSTEVHALSHGRAGDDLTGWQVPRPVRRKSASDQPRSVG